MARKKAKKPSKLIKGAAKVGAAGISEERGKRIRNLLGGMKARVSGLPKGKGAGGKMRGMLGTISRGNTVGLEGKVRARSRLGGMSPTRARRVALLRMAERVSAGASGSGG